MLDILPTVQAKDVTPLLQAILLSAMVQARLLLKSKLEVACICGWSNMFLKAFATKDMGIT
jgi:hypothetical protein